MFPGFSSYSGWYSKVSQLKLYDEGRLHTVRDTQISSVDRQVILSE